MPIPPKYKNPIGVMDFLDALQSINPAELRSKDFNSLMQSLRLVEDRLQEKPSYKPMHLSREYVEVSEEDIASLRAELDLKLNKLDELEGTRTPLCPLAAPFYLQPPGSYMRPLIGVRSLHPE